jgi:transposase
MPGCGSGAVVSSWASPRSRQSCRRCAENPHIPPVQICRTTSAWGGAHFWGREIGKLGHEVRLIPSAYVKPFVKRQKNDAADAEAICEAAQRPTMRFVPVKNEETQGAAMVFRVRELLIRQRTQAINALRGHLTEFGQIVPQGAANAAKLIAIVEEPASGLPADAIGTLKVLVAALTHLEAEIGKLDAEIARRAKANEVARRLMTVPGIGPLIATAIAVLAPPPETFRKARDFAAWLGLVPRQHSTGGKQRLGATTKMGERSLRRLLIIGANSVIIKRHTHAAARSGTWLGGMLDTQAADAGTHSVGEQNGADRLGPDGPGWRLPVSGRAGEPECNRVPSSTRL